MLGFCSCHSTGGPMKEWERKAGIVRVEYVRIYWDRSVSSLTGPHKNPARQRKKSRDILRKKEGRDKGNRMRKKLANAKSVERGHMCRLWVSKCKLPGGDHNCTIFLSFFLSTGNKSKCFFLSVTLWHMTLVQRQTNGVMCSDSEITTRWFIDLLIEQEPERARRAWLLLSKQHLWLPQANQMDVVTNQVYPTWRWG